jgi:2-keto-4-pentenoate hydratase/2-oxohepta-3-ene-1,7-dioic acid hydratase in catechol pathway
LVTTDEAGDVMNLRVTTKVNGETRQDSNTSDMIFSVPFIISYMSQFMTLRVGDVIATGTPEGVAMGMTPPGWLVPGDIVEVEVEGLGAQRSEVVAFTG